MRIAVVDREKCHPKKCNDECERYCPRNRVGDETVKINDRAEIDEITCIGCGICVKKCPYKAISVVNLPEELKRGIVHQYGKNSFRLYHFPIPKFKQVVGILGQNGIGKTTAVNILADQIRPNLGNLNGNEEKKVVEFFKGTEGQAYFEKLYAKGISVAVKPQHVDLMPKIFKGKVSAMLEKLADDESINRVSKSLGISNVLSHNMSELSGGELQRVAIAATIIKDADVYFFDEPSSYLDIKQRLNVAKIIRGLVREDRCIFVVEHDLIILDYLTDLVHVTYGLPGVYGIVSKVMSSREGINSFISGYLRDENMRFRQNGINFEKRTHKDKENEVLISVPSFTKSFNGFKLSSSSGEIYTNETLGIVGGNATGKTTFARVLAGELKPDKGKLGMKLKISYKPQYIKTDSDKTAYELLSEFKQFNTQKHRLDIMKPLKIEPLLDKKIENLSGGELQRVAIAECLSRDADLYLLDEPSAHLDVEQRINAAKAISNICKSATAVVIDHDLMLIDYLADRLLVFSGVPGVSAQTFGPVGVRDGMNRMLKELDITFRREPETNRPRANKPDSVKDREQKKSGKFYS